MDESGGDDSQEGHYLLIYIATVSSLLLNRHFFFVQIINSRSHYKSNELGNWMLKTSSGRTIRNFTLKDIRRDVLLLTLWIWRDLLVTKLARTDTTESTVLSLLKDILATVRERFYHELLENKNFDGISDPRSVQL